MHPQPADGLAPDSPVLVDGHRVGARRFGSVGGWPIVWCHGGLSSVLDAKFFDAAGRRCGADIIAIDRPGIGRSDAWDMSSIAHWPQMVEQVADLLDLDDFAVAGWSAGARTRWRARRRCRIASALWPRWRAWLHSSATGMCSS